MPTPRLLNHSHLRLLRGVSRSFYLSIRLLPSALRAPIALAYLLARATDTVADTPTVPVAQRQALLQLLQAAIDSDHGELASRISVLQEFAAGQTDPHERALMLALPQCMPLLAALPAADQASVRWVLAQITQGQHLDLQRFGHGPGALADDVQLDAYTWQVAGCVGAFWTDICARHWPGFAQQPLPVMRQWGADFGKGLQRLNILRDAGADLAAGRCYLPASRLEALGLNPQQVAAAVQLSDKATLARLAPLWVHVVQQTHQQLADGLRYSQALSGFRLRLATALPVLIGARTLALLHQAGPEALLFPVKMPRHELRALLWRLCLRWAAPAALQSEFDNLSRPIHPSIQNLSLQ